MQQAKTSKFMVCMLRRFDALFPKLRTRHNSFYELLRSQTMKQIIFRFLFGSERLIHEHLPEVMSLDTKLLVLGHLEWGKVEKVRLKKEKRRNPTDTSTIVFRIFREVPHHKTYEHHFRPYFFLKCCNQRVLV